MCWLEFKTPLLPAKKQKTLACIREIQFHKLWIKVYSQKGLTAMQLAWPLLTQHHTHTCLTGGWTGLANAYTLPQVSMHFMAGVGWPGQ